MKGGTEEACIVSRRELDHGDELMLDQDDFSVIKISSGKFPCLMLGPSRFLNHDCRGNARFASGGKGMKIYATKKILAGEEIAVAYSPNYFDKGNKNSLCATCGFMN